MPDRIIREGILTSDKVNALSWQGECFYRRLLNVVDDHGRFDARPEMIRAALFPLKLNQVSQTDCSKLLRESMQADLVRLYEVDGKRFLELIGFDQKGLKHKKAKYPPPENGTYIRFPEEKRREAEIETEVKLMEKCAHTAFAKVLLSEAMTLDREQIEMQCRETITADLLKLFNAHLNTENKIHPNVTEYKKHLRNWINTKPKEKIVSPKKEKVSDFKNDYQEAETKAK